MQAWILRGMPTCLRGRMEELAAYPLCLPGSLWAPRPDPGQKGQKVLPKIDIETEQAVLDSHAASSMYIVRRQWNATVSKVIT